MSIFDSLRISSSGLTAERLRMDVIANNIANANTTQTNEIGPDGLPLPYQREMVVFEPRSGQSSFANMLNNQLSSDPGLGVQVSSIMKDPSPFKLKYDPSDPEAIKDPRSPLYGYVRLPNVDISAEMVDLISASRSYEANVTALNASKAMDLKALDIGK